MLPDNLLISQDDFLLALRDIKPSVLRSVEVESPNIAWDDIGGLDDIKQTLQESFEDALLYPDLYAKTGARAPRGVLLWGPPRTGKTLLAKAIASQAKANFIAVNGPKLMSRLGRVGGTIGAPISGGADGWHDRWRDCCCDRHYSSRFCLGLWGDRDPT